MAEEDNLIESLREKGLTCTKLKSMQNEKINDAKKFRQVGFNNLANREEQSAQDIKNLRSKVCKLR